jgi:hypothetical protein
MKKILPILIFLFTQFYAQAQVKLAIGESTKNEFFYDTKFDPADGGTISVGVINNGGTANDCYLVKLNASKQIVWQKTIINAGDDYFDKVQICANGEYIIAGKRTISGVGRGLICRVNSTNGNIIWSTTSAATGSPNGEAFWDIKETASGNFAVVGPTNYTPGSVNGIVVLVNSTGAQVWSRIYNYTSQSDIFTCVNQLPNGNIILGGFYFSGGGNDKGIIIELNETNAAVISQNEYSIAVSNPNLLAGNFLDGMNYPTCSIVAGNVYFQMNLTNGCCDQNNSQGIYLYDQTSKVLSGNLFHHTGFSKVGNRFFAPIGVNDYVITQSIPGASGVNNNFISRVTNGVKIYDRRVVGNTDLIYNLDINGNNINIVGASTLNAGDGYSMFSTTSFPTSASGCLINNADSLVITANTPTKVINSTPMISVTAMTPISLTSTNTSAVITNICGITPPIVCNNWLRNTNLYSGVTVGDLDINNNAVTIEATCNGIGTLTRSLVSKHSDPSNVNYFLCPDLAQITTTNGFFSVGVPCGYVNNKTYHSALVYDGTTLKLYVNGFLMGQTPATGNLITNNIPTAIGERAQSFLSGSGTNSFQGYINEVRIWNVARTQNQIRQFMSSPLPTPTTQVGLQAYYQFNSLINLQGNATFNGTIVGTGVSLNAINPNCTFVADSCAVIPCPQNTSTTITKCSNQNINLTARAGSTYSWSPSTGLSATNIQSPVCSATTNTTYIATIFNSVTNCTYRDTFNINVNTPATVTTQPNSVTVCAGNAATFTGAGTGTGVTYQWLSGPSAAGPFTNVTTGTGANTSTYTTPVTTPAMNGTYYILIASTTACPAIVTTTAVQLTVNTVASIVTQPASQAVCTPQPATFSVAAIGTGLTYQWQVSTTASPTFTNIVGATNASYTKGPTTFSMNGNQYRVNILSTCSPTVPLTSTAALLTINNPSIAQQPVLQSGCAGDSYTFSVTATSAATLSYQWQSSANGLPGTFTNIAGANASAYTINNAPISLNGYYYRVYISVPCGAGNATDTSNAAQLSLSNRIAIVLTAPYNSNENPAVNSGIFTTVSPVGNYIYTWKRNGLLMPNTSTSKFILLAVDDEASYEVSITDATTNCISKSNIIKTTAKTSDNLLINELFIYPNPASNRILIRFNNSNSSARNTMLNIYDGKGARVYTNAYPIVGTFGNMEVNISNLTPETYMVYLMDADGKKLAGGKFIKVKQ